MSAMAESGAPVEGPPPRLMITHMVNNNFKSYFGTQIVGPFHKVRRYQPYLRSAVADLLFFYSLLFFQFQRGYTKEKKSKSFVCL